MNDIVTVNVNVRLNDRNARVDSALIDLGVLPGFIFLSQVALQTPTSLAISTVPPPVNNHMRVLITG